MMYQVQEKSCAEGQGYPGTTNSYAHTKPTQEQASPDSDRNVEGSSGCLASAPVNTVLQGNRTIKASFSEPFRY